MRTSSLPSSSVDPWLGLREDATAANHQLASLIPRLARLSRDSSSSSSPDLALLKRDADKAVADLTESVAQLDDVVHAVQRDRRRYGLSQDDVDTRATFAGNARLQLQQHLQALSRFDGISSRTNLLSRDSSSPSSSFAAAAAAASKANDAAFSANQLQVQQIITEQDAGLTQLGHSVRLLGDMGKDISVELGQQQLIIDEFDTELNVVSGRFSQAQAKISQVLAEADGGHIKIVLCLVLLLCVLVALLLFID